MELLALVYRISAAEIGLSRAGLDLDKDYLRAVYSYYIYLADFVFIIQYRAISPRLQHA